MSERDVLGEIEDKYGLMAAALALVGTILLVTPLLLLWLVWSLYYIWPAFLPVILALYFIGGVRND